MLKKYDAQYTKARDEYLLMMEGTTEADLLFQCILNKEINPYRIFAKQYASNFSTLEGVVGMYQFVNHALYDDGDITFVKTNYGPLIVFYWKGESNFEEVFQNDFYQERIIRDITGYCDSVVDFIAEYDRYEEEVSRV